MLPSIPTSESTSTNTTSAITLKFTPSRNFDDEIDLDPTIEEPTETVEHQESEEERRRRARREIERRNELKALKSELDEWDELLNEVDL